MQKVYPINSPQVSPLDSLCAKENALLPNWSKAGNALVTWHLDTNFRAQKSFDWHVLYTTLHWRTLGKVEDRNAV